MLEQRSAPLEPLRLALPLWGAGGVLLIMLQGASRLIPPAIEPLARGDLLWWQLGLYGLSICFNGYVKGYRVMHRSFAPRVAARALHLSREPWSLIALVAPLYCMGLLRATRRRLLVSWSVLVGVVGLIVVVRRLDQPYRGIVDAGVVVGLLWGAIALVLFLLRGARGKQLPVPPDVPPRR